MEEFNKLRSKLDLIEKKLITGVNDIKLTDQINGVRKYIDTQEKYYKSIPENLRTSNTINIIISRLNYSIEQLDKINDSIPADFEANFSKQVHMRESVEEENVITYAYLRECKDEKNEKQNEITQLNTSLNEKQREITQLNTSLNEKQEEITQLNAGLNEKQEKINQLNADLARLNIDLAQLNIDLALLNTGLTDKQAIIDQKDEDLKKCREEKQAIIDLKEKEIADLTKSLNDMKLDLDTKKMEIAQKDEDLKKCREEKQAIIDQMDRDLEECKKEKQAIINSKQREINEKDEDLERCRELNKVHELNINIINDRYESLREKYDIINRKYQECITENTSYEDDLISTRNKLNNSMEDIANLKQSLHSMNLDLLSAQSSYTTAQLDLDATVENLRTEKQNYTILKNQYETGMRALQDKIDVCQLRVKELENEITQLKSQTPIPVQRELVNEDSLSNAIDKLNSYIRAFNLNGKTDAIQVDIDKGTKTWINNTRFYYGSEFIDEFNKFKDYFNNYKGRIIPNDAEKYKEIDKYKLIDEIKKKRGSGPDRSINQNHGCIIQ